MAVAEPARVALGLALLGWDKPACQAVPGHGRPFTTVGAPLGPGSPFCLLAEAVEGFLGSLLHLRLEQVDAARGCGVLPGQRP